jgi:hypothetical protein
MQPNLPTLFAPQSQAPVYLRFRRFNIWIAEQGGKWFHANLTGQQLYSARFDFVWHFSEVAAAIPGKILLCLGLQKRSSACKRDRKFKIILH